MNRSDSALRVYYMAHRFLDEFGIKWLPVNPEDIIDQRPNWRMKYVSQLAYETGQTDEPILHHVMRSQDGLSMYDVKNDSYCIIINAADYIPEGRILWTKLHEIGHIYLGHLVKYKVTELHKDDLGEDLYNQLEFEADIFAGEVLASKWIMRQLDIYSEHDISEICGISDKAALNRYRKATEDYSFTPANATFTLHRFEEYLKEITVCADREEIDLGHYAKVNPAQKKFRTPMAPFLRKPDVCPYCGKKHNKDAKFCPYCGSALQKQLSNIPGVHCWNRQSAADAAFCEQCGNPVLRIRQGFCFEECEI